MQAQQVDMAEIVTAVSAALEGRPHTTVWASAKHLAARYDSSIPTIWRWAANGKLPKPSKLSDGTSRWHVPTCDRALGLID